MAAPLCTPTEVAETLGVAEYTGVELAQVTRLCTLVSGLIRTRTRQQIDAWITAGQVDPDMVSGIACQVVIRVKATLGAGGGAIRSEQHPEYGYQLSASALAGLDLTDAELSQLTPAADDRGAFTIRPGGRPQPAAVYPGSAPFITVPASTSVTRTVERDVVGVSSGSDDDTVITQAPTTGTVTKVEYVPEAAITGAATNNRTVSVVNKGQAGTGTTVVATLTFSSGTNAAAYDEVTIPLSVTASDLAVAAGDTLLWRSTHNGSGRADPGGLVRLTFTD